jgi:hypothetical protein
MLFPRFLERWPDSYWERILRLAVHSYLAAGDPPSVQHGIVSAQIAHELLTYALLVEERGLLTDGQYRAKPFGVLHSLLLQELGIPSTIPDLCPDLKMAGVVETWANGPQAIASLRNRVVHPRRSHGTVDFAVWIDAWLLSVQYIELALLALLGYRGVYGNRLKRPRHAGEVEPVPWAS